MRIARFAKGDGVAYGVVEGPGPRVTIAELTACCVKFKASAARVMCWRSATATKMRSCSRVIPLSLPRECPRR